MGCFESGTWFRMGSCVHIGIFGRGVNYGSKVGPASPCCGLIDLSHLVSLTYASAGLSSKVSSVSVSGAPRVDLGV